ncbi:hypothetical protein GCM10009123_20740 [Kangiella japonica]|uniref:DUF3466 family protein n=1 Tax=Kangiella japonica TaxID=647384 RepID=A0ABN0T657_9GAMM
MKLKTTKKLLALSIATLVSTSMAAPYEVVDLGGLGGTTSVVYDINEAGQAVGYANGPLNDEGEREFFAHAVQFDDSGNVDLGTLENGTSSEAVGINDAMVAVGLSNVSSESDGVKIAQQFAVVYESGTVSKILDIEGVSSVVAYDINNNNKVILGANYDVEPDNDDIGKPSRGFIYDRNTDQYSIIEPFAEDPSRNSYVTAINDNDDIVGFADIEDGESFRIASYFANASDVSTKIEIETIDNRALFARSINNKQEVVGNIYITGTRDNREAFYIDMSAGNPELKLLGFFDEDFTDSRAMDINNVGQIVGRALVSVPTIGESGAFLYENEEMKNLNELIACDSPWTLTEARAINDAGQIVGFGTVDGEIRAFRLDPTGEPVEDCGETNPQPSDGGGSVPVILLGILAALGIRRRYS